VQVYNRSLTSILQKS